MYKPLGQGSTYHIHWQPLVERILAENAKHHADRVARESKAAVIIEKFFSGAVSALDTISHPTNPHELWRCINLFVVHPEYKERIAELANLSPAWRLLVQYWQPLEKMCREEWPNYDAPYTAEKMKRMLASVR